MLSQERKNELLNYIAQSGYIKVEKLAEKMFMSSSTIRRNLTELEKQGLVKRSYGAVQLTDSGNLAPLQLRFQKNHHEKQIIAEKASKYLKDNSVIFVDASSSCIYLVPHLAKLKNITVYTNSLEICGMLKDNGVTVYCTGGKLIPQSLAFAGDMALKAVENMYFDAFIFSAAGLCDDIISDPFEDENIVRRRLLDLSENIYMLCDTSKIGKRFNYTICKTDKITEIITE